MRSLIVISLMFFCVSLSLSGEDHLTLRAVPNEIYPGDLFELKFEGSSQVIRSYHLKIPPISSFHLIAKESFPVVLENGCFIQKETWVLQCDTVGLFSIDKAMAVYTDSGKEFLILLPTVRINVLAYPEADEINEPESWPEVAAASAGVERWWIICLLFVACVLVFVCFKKRGNQKDLPVNHDQSRLDRVLMDLESIGLTAPSLQEWLDEQGDSLSPDLRIKIEKIIYGNTGDAALLTTLLKKEVRS